MLSPQQLQRLERLRSTIRACGSALVAYSGGVDSALVMAIAHEQLGGKMLACIGSSPSYPQREMREAAISRPALKAWLDGNVDRIKILPDDWQDTFRLQCEEAFADLRNREAA